MQEPLSSLMDKKDKCVIISLCARPGLQLFMTRLEYEHYPPRTPANDKFEVAVVQWEETFFYAIVIPREDTGLAHKIADQLGMTLTPELVIALVVAGKPKEFPVHGENIFMVEGTYQGDEKAAIDKIFAADEPSRTAYIRENLTLAAVDKEYLRAWTESLNVYPLLHEHLVKTNAEVLECFVAFVNEAPYGFVTICKNDGGTYLGMIWVEEHSRRIGIADFLFKAAVGFCVDHDLCKLKVESRSSIFDKIMTKIPMSFEEEGILKTTTLNHDFSVEQEKVGPRYGRN